MNRSSALVLVTSLALAACSGEAPQPAPSDAAPSPALDPALASPLPGTGEPAPSTAQPSAAPTMTSPMGATFPPAMIGRWGMVPADCTSQRGDNKGMITITPGEIRFYESVATIAAIKESGANRLRATLAFEGEGMQWTRDAQFDAKPASDQVVLQEFGDDAVPGPRTYTRCK